MSGRITFSSNECFFYIIILCHQYVLDHFEQFQVHLKSQFILNGVCVIWRGWIDLTRLDGIGCIEYDAERAMVSAY